MLIKGSINYSLTDHPQLSRVWIKTGDSRMPLKSVWIDESKLRRFGREFRGSTHQGQMRELAEDHLVLAA